MENINKNCGLFVLTFAEFWDRFSFSGTLTILILYLNKIFLFVDAKAYASWGAYAALGYIMPVIGGVLADRVIGFERAIIMGLCLIILGNAILVFPSPTGLAIGLSLSLCGIGFFKGNISSLVGMLYKPSQELAREKGYSIFFMGIVLGATLGPLIYGLVIIYSSWDKVFLLNTIGNLSSLVLYVAVRRKFSYKNMPPKPELSQKYVIGKINAYQFFNFGLIGVATIISLFFIFPISSNTFLGMASLIALFLQLLLGSHLPRHERKKIIGLMLLNLLLIGYYAAFLQANGSIVIGLERNFRLFFVGRLIPATLFACLSTSFAFLLSPLLGKVWFYWSKKFFTPSMFLKILLGHIFTGISFAIFALVFLTKQHALLGLIMANLFLGMSIVCIFPIHVSAVSSYSPTEFQGILMGMSLLPLAVAGYVGSLATHLLESFSKFHSENICYACIYMLISVAMFALAILISFFSPFLKSLFQDMPQEEIY